MLRKRGQVSAALVAVTIYVPVNFLDRIDELIEKGEYPSVSSFVREAVQRYVRKLKRKSK